MKPRYFMRNPFLVAAYQVTESNMDAIARWCQGHVIRDAERPFVRVPVNRTTNKRQTEAYEGCWVLLSKQRGENSFKVYTQEWLDKNFVEVPHAEFDENDTQEIPPLPEPAPQKARPSCNCGEDHEPIPAPRPSPGNVVGLGVPRQLATRPGLHTVPLHS